MPISSVLDVYGRGRTNREIVLNEIKEMRKEVKALAQKLATLEQFVATQPDDGILKMHDRMPTPIISLGQMEAVTGWIISIYESYYMIGYAGLGRLFSQNIAIKFGAMISKVNSVQWSIPGTGSS